MPVATVDPIVALRRSNRQWRLATAGLAAALALVLATGAKREDVRQADRYELVDEQGVVRGVMGTFADRPFLRLEGEDGSGVVVIAREGGVSMSMFTDSPQHPRVHVDATAAGSLVTLLDRNGGARARVELAANGDLLAITRDLDDPVASAPAPIGPAGLHHLLDTTPR
jgi:hypothetical protein